MTWSLRDAVSRLRCRLMEPFLPYLPKEKLSLADLATLYRSDKGHRWFSRHGYTDIYDRLLRPRKRDALTLLEIGLRHDPFYADRERTSPSLRMWHDYFPRARIVGFDINDFTGLSGGRMLVVQGDQGAADDLGRLLATVPAFDVIVDDGSHAAWHQRRTLETLFPALNPGGLYFIEDLHARPAELEATLPPTPPIPELLARADYLRGLGISPADLRIERNGRLAVLRKPAG